jgi:hypothetical protein
MEAPARPECVIDWCLLSFFEWKPVDATSVEIHILRFDSQASRPLRLIILHFNQQLFVRVLIEFFIFATFSNMMIPLLV